WALARLAIQESLRRHVLVVLGLFALIVLFAGWFLDPTSVNPGKLYLGFMLGATNLLVCLVTLILSVFSIPADIKAKAIQTVTTKPVTEPSSAFSSMTSAARSSCSCRTLRTTNAQPTAPIRASSTV
ncbi:MAG: hypothetical protein ACK53Y_19985, partial [bacterium]